MVTETKRFTVQVGDHLIELPEASTRNEALRKIGLNPVHWPEHTTSKRQIRKGKAIRAKTSHSTTTKQKKHVLNVTTGKRSGMSMASVANFVTLTEKCNASVCLFCGKPILALRSTKRFCSTKCRVKYFRSNANN